MEFKRIDSKTICCRISKGEDIFASLIELAKKENIKAAKVSGIGACDYLELSLFNIKEKKYYPKEFKGEYELTSLLGNISIKENAPHLHLHVTISDEECRAFGGHLNKAIVSATCEIFIVTYHLEVNRKFDDETGLYLLDLSK